jgi:hypothetical protein
MDINTLSNIVESGIKKLNLNPAHLRTGADGLWKTQKGSASISIGVEVSNKYPNGYFFVSSVLMDLTFIKEINKEKLFKKLLELNSSLVGMQLTLRDDKITLISNRFAEGLDETEVALSINELSFYADDLDDFLVNFISDL